MSVVRIARRKWWISDCPPVFNVRAKQRALIQAGDYTKMDPSKLRKSFQRWMIEKGYRKLWSKPPVPTAAD